MQSRHTAAYSATRAGEAEETRHGVNRKSARVARSLTLPNYANLTEESGRRSSGY